jgi:hypothetical protein
MFNNNKEINQFQSIAKVAKVAEVNKNPFRSIVFIESFDSIIDGMLYQNFSEEEIQNTIQQLQQNFDTGYDQRYYIDANNQMITTKLFKDGIEADYPGVKFTAMIKLG